jgi:plastocyanin domain-containing protein
MNKITYIAIILILVPAITISTVLLSASKSDDVVGGGELVQNVEVKGGIQYVTVNAKGGYSPRVSTAKANIPTKLIVKTNGTYDCSVSLVIRSVGFRKILAQTGEEVIDLGTPKAGEKTQGLCSMGMYNFSVNFN